VGRIDKKHRFPIRVDQDLHNDIQALAFRYQISLNSLYNEMIIFASGNQAFIQFLNEAYKPDDRRGHFVYIRDERR